MGRFSVTCHNSRTLLASMRKERAGKESVFLRLDLYVTKKVPFMAEGFLQLLGGPPNLQKMFSKL